MRFKILLAGNNKNLIGDFFNQMDVSFECMSSSMIFDDLKHHVHYFKPDLFLYCMRAESRENMITIASLHVMLAEQNIPYAALGDVYCKEDLTKIVNAEPELFLQLAGTTPELQERIVNFIQYQRSKHRRTSLAPDNTDDETFDQDEMHDSAEISSDTDVTNDAHNESVNDSDITNDTTANPDVTYENTDESIPVETEAEEEVPVKRHRILVVDDATIIHKTIKGYLSPEYEIATAISGKIALRYLKTREVSLILLDYEMPDMNGPEVLAELRKDPYLSQIPVVFLTGINDVAKTKSALALKPQGYLLKPVDKNALIGKIHELIK